MSQASANSNSTSSAFVQQMRTKLLGGAQQTAPKAPPAPAWVNEWGFGSQTDVEPLVPNIRTVLGLPPKPLNKKRPQKKGKEPDIKGIDAANPFEAMNAMAILAAGKWQQNYKKKPVSADRQLMSLIKQEKSLSDIHNALNIAI